MEIGSSRLEALIADVQRNPWKLRHLRREINELAGAPLGARVGHLLQNNKETHFSPSGHSAVLGELDTIQDLATQVALFPAQPINLPLPVYLTEEKPSAIVNRPKSDVSSKPILGYISEPGDYKISFAFDVPIMLTLGSSEPKVVVEQSSPHYDAIYGCGIADLASKPEFSCELLAVVYDEFLGNNYSHWLLDWLPRFYYLQEMDVDLRLVTILLSRRATPYQTATLKKLGIDESQCVEIIDNKAISASAILARRFVGTSTTNLSFSHALHGGSKFVADYIRSSAPSIAPSFSISKVVLQRKGTRKLIFSDRTTTILETLGFATVYLEDLSFDEQVALFSSAMCILAAHGAGLANIVFCRPGTEVLEIFPTGYSTAAYWLTACATNVRYACAVAPTASAGNGSHIRDADILVPDECIANWLSILP